MKTKFSSTIVLAAYMAFVVGSRQLATATEPPQATPAAQKPAPSDVAEEDELHVIEPPKLPEPEGAKRISEEDFVWVDAKRHQVLIDGYIVLREGYLEMFACLPDTKEHESIVAARTRAQTVHAALLAVGAKAGHPVEYRPKFIPATGSVIEIEVRWLDEKGNWKSARAQDWIQNLHTKAPMTEDWVFGGSGFWTDEKTGKQYYMAESGDFICVSNFTTAMLDLPVESSQANDGLLFAVKPKVVPPLGTPVRLVLTPGEFKGKKNAE